MMGPTQLVLAAMLLIETTVMALSGADTASAPRRVAAVPMVWHVERLAGSASDHRSCSVISRGGEVTARLLETGQVQPPAWSVVVGFDNQPGSLRYLRINDSYFTSDEPLFHGAEAEAIVALLKSPGEFAFEWAQRPDYAKRLGLFGTGNFAVKAAECEDWMKGTRA